MSVYVGNTEVEITDTLENCLDFIEAVKERFND